MVAAVKPAGVVEGRDVMAVPAARAAMQHLVRDLGRPGVFAEAIPAVGLGLELRAADTEQFRVA